MSRLNPEEDVRTPNPAGRFFQWGGASGVVEYYDKEAKKKVEVKLPFTFLPIDRLITLKGYDDDKKMSYWSNEVKDITKDVFTLQSVSGGAQNKVIRTIVQGLYKDIKPTLDSLDISYVESLYIGIKGAAGLELCNFQIKGAAIGSWITFCKENKIWEIAVKISGINDKKKGSVKYKEPIYTPVLKISDDMQKEAVALNVKLNEYLAEYFAKNAAKLAEAPKTETTTIIAEKKETTKTFDDSKHKDAQSSKVTIEEEAPDILFADANAPDEF